MIAAHDRIVDRIEAGIHVPMHETPLLPVEQEIRNHLEQNDPSMLWSWAGGLAWMRQWLQRDQATIDGVLTGIAVELYRRKYGQWPGTLDQLVPQYLPAVPIDRITGEPIRYRIGEDGPMVYSVGCDLDDDGGRPPRNETRPRPRPSIASHASQWLTDAQRLQIGAHVPDGDWVLWPVPHQR